jgi:CubicO group peptidase (beta-lactamase class C family)
MYSLMRRSSGAVGITIANRRRRASFLIGATCTLSLALATRAAAQTPVIPGATWQAVASPEEAGWSSARLAQIRGVVDSLGSSAFMIVTDGRVVVAWGDTSKTFLSHSIRKSFMSALVGIAVAEGKVDTSRTLVQLGITERSVTLTRQEQSARLVDLLRARSGVYLAAAGEVESMRLDRPARGSHPPGTFWYYNNWDFNVLGTVYRRATGEDIFRAIDEKLAKPIGMQDYRADDGEYYMEEPSQHAGYIFRISARDLARFGLLYLNRGRWVDQQLIDPAWVDASIRSYSVVTGNQASLAHRSGYGFMWWIQTNAKAHPELGIPDGTFTASGLGGQRLTVIPPIRTVIVNLMNTDVPGPRLGGDDWDALLAKLMGARLR